MPGEQGTVSPEKYKTTVLSIKRNIAKNLKWTLHDIDETDFCNLVEFIQFRVDDDPNVRVINGKEYRRAKEVPNWL